MYEVEKVDFKNWVCDACGYKITPVETKIQFKKEKDGKITVIHKKTFTKTKEELLEEIKEGIKKSEDGIIIHEEEVKKCKDDIKILKKREQKILRL